MRTLNEEIVRIRSEVASIAVKTFSDNSVQQKVNQHFSEITYQEYEAAGKVWDELYHRRRELQEELYHINNQITIIEKIICQPIKET